MNVEVVLKYQSLDSELFKLEKGLKENQNKKVVDSLMENMKKAQVRSVKLEESAGKLLGEIEKVKSQVKIQETKMNEFISKDLEKMSKEEIEKYQPKELVIKVFLDFDKKDYLIADVKFCYEENEFNT